MSAIRGFIYKHKKTIIFILLIVISISLMFVYNQGPVITLKKIGFSVIYPFQYLFNSVGDFFQNTFNSISQLKKLKEDLDNTRNELTQYKKIIIDFNELNNENIKLKKLLKLKEEIIYDAIACKVVGRDPKRLFDVLIINKGTNNGIKENMPVISYTGGNKTLVGKIVETTPFASKIITLQNPILSVGAVIVKNRVHTIIQGRNKTPGIVRMLYIPKTYMLSNTKMDFVYTSGDSFIFPRGIEIGRILKIYPSKRFEIFNEADVQISVDFSKLEYVAVLMVDYKKDDFMLHGLQN